MPAGWNIPTPILPGKGPFYMEDVSGQAGPMGLPCTVNGELLDSCDTREDCCLHLKASAILNTE